MKTWILAGGMALSLGARADVDLGGNYPNFAKVAAQLDVAGPRYMEGILDLLADQCPRSAPPEVCAFAAIAQDYARFLSDWRKEISPEYQELVGEITLAPGSDEVAWRAGLWNVDPSRADQVAEKTAEVFARELIAQAAMRRSFVQVADYIQKLGRGAGGNFGELQRPVVSAWMNSTSPIARIGALSQEMRCAQDQFGCRAVQAKLSQAVWSATENLRPALSVLSSLNGDQFLSSVIALQSSLDLIAQADPMEVRWWLESPEFAKVPAVRAYLDRLVPILLHRKNLMPGRYGVADQLTALVVLTDLQKFAQTRVEAPAPIALDPASEAQLNQLVQLLGPTFEKYRRGVERLLEVARPSPTS